MTKIENKKLSSVLRKIHPKSIEAFRDNYMLENELNTVSIYNYNILVKFGVLVFWWHIYFATKALKHKIIPNLKQ